MNTPLIIIHIIICLIIIFIVLLQVGKGAEAGAVFGGAGQAHTPRTTTTFIGKFTAGIAVAFMLTSFFLTYQTSNTAKRSVTEKVTRQEQKSDDMKTPENTAADVSDQVDSSGENSDSIPQTPEKPAKQ